MSSRTYLSIGDVLTLLREEFPDVTISKIRFLESQGLVNPERSPSGYRKFFDHDVERLRWVLRQQREHFLPLKVIRDRLADGELDEGAADGPNGKPAHAAAPAAVRSEQQPTKADEEAMARILADASRRAARMPEAAKARGGLQVVGEGAGAETAHVAAEPGTRARRGLDRHRARFPRRAHLGRRRWTDPRAEQRPAGAGAGDGTRQRGARSPPRRGEAAGPRTASAAGEPPTRRARHRPAAVRQGAPRRRARLPPS